ncbi:MAG: CHAT domain-containing protein [Saprospiraceae bacterium]|nr:CHAT domain-containing protein [Saprospiraceae bacterium]
MSKFRSNNIKNRRLITPWLVVIGLFFVLNLSLRAQDSTSLEIMREAVRYHKDGELEEARTLYKSVISEFSQTKSWKEWDTCYLGIWRTSFHLNDKKAFSNLLPQYIESLPEEKFLLRGIAYGRNAYALQLLGEVYESYKTLITGLSTINNVKDSIKTRDEIKWKVFFYKKLSNVNSQLGDQVTAIKYAEEGLNFAQSLNDSSNSKDFSLLLGIYEFNNQQVEKALSHYRNVEENYQPDVYLHQYFAEAYLTIDRLDSVKKHLDLAQEYLTSTKGSKAYFNQISYWSQYYFKMGQPQKGFELRELQIDSLRKLKNHRFFLRELTTHAQNHFEYGNDEKSMRFAQEVLKKHYVEIDSLDIMDRPLLNEGLPDIHIIKALYLKAQYFTKKYKLENDAQYLEEAIFYYETLLTLFDRLKSTYNSSRSQYQLSEYSQTIYSKAILFFSDLYQKAHDIAYFEKAFQLAQGANAFVLKNSVDERKRFELAEVPKDSINKYFYLKSLATQNNSEDKGIQHLDVFNTYKSTLFNLYPTLINYENNQTVELQTLQQSLKPKDLLIKYFYTGSEFVRFTISNKQIALDQIPFSETFTELTKEIQFIISNNKNWNEAKYAEVSKKLYDRIIGDVLENEIASSKSHLIIAPDGPLKNLSFSSLITSEVDHVIQTNDYLLYNYEVSYVYYCAQLNTETKATKNSKEFIGFGLEYSDTSLDQIIDTYMQIRSASNNDRLISISQLKYAVKEVRNISKILNGDILLNDQVLKATVLSTIQDYDIAHFSAHAFVNENDYLNSFIVLNRDDKGDYQLTYRDIINLNLDSKMVVLSACQTGSGTDMTGEGLMSLSRAFIQSGCNSSIGSYWNASDKSTMELMQLFYTNITQGMSKSAALRNAQLTFLNERTIQSPRNRLPFYWSSWAIYGETAPIVKKSYIDYLSTITLLLVGILLFVSFVYRKKMLNPT